MTMAPSEALSAVRAARGCLMAAQFALDDHGYSCVLLDRLHDGAATLLAEWAGRERPSAFGPHVIAAAQEWRRQAKRSY